MSTSPLSAGPLALHRYASPLAVPKTPVAKSFDSRRAASVVRTARSLPNARISQCGGRATRDVSASKAMIERIRHISMALSMVRAPVFELPRCPGFSHGSMLLRVTALTLSTGRMRPLTDVGGVDYHPHNEWQ